MYELLEKIFAFVLRLEPFDIGLRVVFDAILELLAK